MAHGVPQHGCPRGPVTELIDLVFMPALTLDLQVELAGDPKRRAEEYSVLD